MRDEYELKNGVPNPYLERLGRKGRADLVRWWESVSGGVRVLPEDVAREFPDTESTVAALRLVMELRAIGPSDGRRSRPKAAKSKKRAVG